MNFRKLVITGFIAGAAILVPDMAFAEKVPNTGKPQQPVPAEQVTLPDKAENARIPEKTSAEPAGKKQPVQKPAVQKPAQAHSKVVAVKSNGKAPSFKKTEKAPLPHKAKTLTNEKSIQAKHKTKPNIKQSRNDAVKPIHNKGNYVKETKRRLPGLKEKVEPSKGSAVTKSFVNLTAKTASKKTPPVKPDEKNPSKNERYPKGDNLPNPPSRTKASGGPSSDRTSYGNSSTFFTDKWFVWDEAFNLSLIQPYTSRVAFFQNQWVNAPPSPPPLNAPAFLPYTNAIATDNVN